MVARPSHPSNPQAMAGLEIREKGGVIGVSAGFFGRGRELGWQVGVKVWFKAVQNLCIWRAQITLKGLGQTVNIPKISLDRPSCTRCFPMFGFCLCSD